MTTDGTLEKIYNFRWCAADYSVPQCSRTKNSEYFYIALPTSDLVFLCRILELSWAPVSALSVAKDVWLPNSSWQALIDDAITPLSDSK